MTRTSGFAVAALLWVWLSACTVALHRDRDQCQTSLDCQKLEQGAVCTADGVCETVSPVSACQKDADCLDAGSLCRGSMCESLVVRKPQCRLISGGNPPKDRPRLPLAVLVPPTALSNTAGGEVVAAQIAINQLNAAGSQNPMVPWLVAVACDETDGSVVETLLQALQVHILVGPMLSADLSSVATALPGQAVLFAPFADAPEYAIERGTALGSSLVSCKSNRRDSAADVISGIEYVAQRLGVAFSETTLALSQEEWDLSYGQIFGAHTLDNVSTVVRYEASGRAFAESVDGQTRVPALVVSASDEVDWSDNIKTLDADRLGAGNRPPYYLLADEQLSVLGLVYTDQQSRIPRASRVFGLDNHLQRSNVEAQLTLQAAFQSTTSSAMPPALSYVYDCVHLAVYAALAAQSRFALAPTELRPASLLAGLRALTGGNADQVKLLDDVAPIMQRLQQSLGADHSLNLVGTSGNLSFSRLPSVDQIVAAPTAWYLSPDAAPKELYCINAGQHSFVKSGLIFSGAEEPAKAAQSNGCFAD